MRSMELRIMKPMGHYEATRNLLAEELHKRIVEAPTHPFGADSVAIGAQCPLIATPHLSRWVVYPRPRRSIIILSPECFEYLFTLHSLLA
jgi:hypothetical protein